MFLYATILFALATPGGFALAAHTFRGKNPPWILSIIHGLFGFSGLAILIYILINGPQWPEKLHNAVIALMLFSLVALTGLLFAAMHRKNHVPTKSMVAVHSVLAVCGLIALGLTF